VNPLARLCQLTYYGAIYIILLTLYFCSGILRKYID